MVDESHIYLDLAKDVWQWRCSRPVDVAVVCAGKTKLDACESDPDGTARVNVHGAAMLVADLVERGAFVIYLSTNLVFDGSIPHRLPHDPFSPVTEYGRQKAEVESLISQWGDSVAIVRLTKVLGPTVPLFSGWSEALRRGETIHPFSDMCMAPVPLSCVLSVLQLVGEGRLSGVVQVSGERDISYSEAAQLGATLLKVDPGLVKAIEAHESGLHTGPIPAHTTLNVDRLKFTLGVEPPDVDWTVGKAFTEAQALVGHSEVRAYLS